MKKISGYEKDCNEIDFSEMYPKVIKSHNLETICFELNIQQPHLYECKKCSRKCRLQIESKKRNPEFPKCPYGNNPNWIKKV